ncbi:MAG: nucleotidyltransferase family protein [Saprospiraceae bacterium]
MASIFSNQVPDFQILCSILSSKKTENQKSLLKQNFKKVDADRLFQEAKNDEITSHLIYALEESGIEYNREWKEDFIETEKRIVNLMNELENVAIHLKEKDINVVGLKNAGITKGIYINYACSPMGDLDLLVSSKDFHKAHEIILNELGYTFKFRSEFEREDLEDAFKGGGTEYYKIVNGYKIWLELQWRPVAGRWIQPHNEPNGDELMKRSIPIEGSAVRLLAPEDNLLQVCLHTAKHSYCRAPGFRLHTDVDRIVHYTIIDWKKFLNQAKTMKLKTAVYYSLLIPKELLYTPVPQEVINTLKPNWIRRFIIEKLLTKAGLMNQHKKKFSKIGYILFNLSLYDSISEMSTAIFPSSQVMKKRYDFNNSFLLPYFHIKRLTSLVLKRAKL